jgi:CDP-diglyceride synthetase
MNTVIRVGAVYCIFVLAVGLYVWAWRNLSMLVAEAKEFSPESRYRLILWLPAWKAHKRACPTSKMRRRIIALFVLTFALLILSLFLIGYRSVTVYHSDSMIMPFAYRIPVAGATGFGRSVSNIAT